MNPRIPVRILEADGFGYFCLTWMHMYLRIMQVQKSDGSRILEEFREHLISPGLHFKNCDENSVQNSWSRLNLAYLDAYHFKNQGCYE